MATTIVFRLHQTRQGGSDAEESTFRCELSALTAHFQGAPLAKLACEAVNRAGSQGVTREVELHLAFEPDALRAALHAYTTGSLQGAQLPASADLDWIQTEVIQKYGIPLGVAALLERRPSAGPQGVPAPVQGLGAGLDPWTLRLYLEAKAEPAAKAILSMLTPEVVGVLDSALFLVSSQPPTEPKRYGGRPFNGFGEGFRGLDDVYEAPSPEPDRWDDEMAFYEEQERPYIIDVAPPYDGAPRELFVSRCLGSGKPTRVVREDSDKARGIYWRLHANLLSGALPGRLLQAVADVATRLAPAGVEASVVPCDLGGPAVEECKEEGAGAGEAANTVYLVRVTWAGLGGQRPAAAEQAARSDPGPGCSTGSA
ncbi:hypothetical protein HYH03_012878 [Edaphochlamys debaryana]|uniref:Uncharacterized protein n=1 Tax=Edaphochlamys debaryana TaxID=47281 RepID=A0A836BV26_9CHLO|nr:hypothetical protein HYH03_012878 [Edaphochlamys debaryana]|eukprot:KAG2488559.1 hypothetical protein HYH03_012878 [Edaphochlamys debaryana]